MTMLSVTAEKAINAYGGMEAWQKATHIEAVVSVKGLAFTLKRRPFFDHASIRMEIKKPYSKLTPIGKNKNISGVLDGNDVRLEDITGGILKERKNVRKYFPYGRRLFWWDDMDMAYFANYAFWNYFTFPNLLLNKDIVWKEIKEGELEATFPDSIPTHNQVQKFIIDKNSGRLTQHNYTAEVISSLATAANVITEHKESNGILFTSRKIVTPRNKQDKALNWPILIDIMVHEFKLM